MQFIHLWVGVHGMQAVYIDERKCTYTLHSPLRCGENLLPRLQRLYYIDARL